NQIHPVAGRAVIDGGPGDEDLSGRGLCYPHIGERGVEGDRSRIGGNDFIELAENVVDKVAAGAEPDVVSWDIEDGAGEVADLDIVGEIVPAEGFVIDVRVGDGFGQFVGSNAGELVEIGGDAGEAVGGGGDRGGHSAGDAADIDRRDVAEVSDGDREGATGAAGDGNVAAERRGAGDAVQAGQHIGGGRQRTVGYGGDGGRRGSCDGGGERAGICVGQGTHERDCEGTAGVARDI